MKVSELIKAKRKGRKLSVKDVINALAERGIAVSEKTLYGWESGHRQPDADTFLVLCDIYGIDNIAQAVGIEKSSVKEDPMTEDEMESMAESIYHALLEAGLVKQGQDLTEAQIKALESIAYIASAFFNEID